MSDNGSAANSDARRERCWRETRRGGRPVLVSPEGRVCYGTAAEVRDAGLAPHRREWLKQSIVTMRYLLARGAVDASEFARIVTERRREAMLMGAADFTGTHGAGRFTLREVLRIRAAARLSGSSADGFVRGLVADAVAAAEAAAGGSLPFTRHEREALARC